jgi:hypothetical protein
MEIIQVKCTNPTIPIMEVDQSQTWQTREIQPDDGRTLVLDYTFQACPTTKKNRKKILGKAGPES